MKYYSTRDTSALYASSFCIEKGLAADGGLFVPFCDSFDNYFIRGFNPYSAYKEVAGQILSYFFSDFSDTQIADCVNKAYNRGNFDENGIVALRTFKDISVLELTHGRTCAFKDVALSVLPHLINAAKDNLGKGDIRTLIVTATSGDTGKAALEGFRDVQNTEVIVFYPYGGVSAIQLKQMLTQQGNNVHAVAVKGNFDDVQTAVKNIFADKSFNDELIKRNIALSSANSINIGRLIPQIVYYFTAYGQLVKNGTIKYGDKINFCVPSGNFGNILAGYYAWKMGLKINRLICASNENNVLYDFFAAGVYDISDRVFRKTISPSMDILVSSNLERLLFEICGRSDEALSRLMNSLHDNGRFAVDINGRVKELFYGGYALESEILTAIKDFYRQNSYVLDTHTAAGCKVMYDYKAATGDKTHTVLLSTASPYKFTSDVLYGLCGEKIDDASHAAEKLYRLSGAEIPGVIKELDILAEKNEIITEKENMKNCIRQILK